MSDGSSFVIVYKVIANHFCSQFFWTKSIERKFFRDGKSAVRYLTSEMVLAHQMYVIDQVQDMCTLY